MKIISNTIASLLIAFHMPCDAQTPSVKTITKNSMTMKYHHQANKLSIELSAPTSGWLAIGFNAQQSIKGTHLVMCHVVDDKIKVVEHYTVSPGNYQAISALGGENAVSNIKGRQHGQTTNISFDLSIDPVDRYHKNLAKGNAYFITLAYSQSDDFQHHSVMRTQFKSVL
jgi:hypothetical protein